MTRVLVVVAAGAVVVPVVTFVVDQVVVQEAPRAGVTWRWAWPVAAVIFIALAAGSAALWAPRAVVVEPLPSPWWWTSVALLGPAALIVLGRMLQISCAMQVRVGEEADFRCVPGRVPPVFPQAGFVAWCVAVVLCGWAIVWWWRTADLRSWFVVRTTVAASAAALGGLLLIWTFQILLVASLPHDPGFPTPQLHHLWTVEVTGVLAFLVGGAGLIRLLTPPALVSARDGAPAVG